MEKRKIIILLSILVLTMFLTCNISYANNADVDKFANEQLQYYIEGYKTAYQDYGFSSQSEMENSKLGNPIHLYWIDKLKFETLKLETPEYQCLTGSFHRRTTTPFPFQKMVYI